MGILTSSIQKVTFSGAVPSTSSNSTNSTTNASAKKNLKHVGSCFLLDDGTAMMDVILVEREEKENGNNGHDRQHGILNTLDWKEGDVVNCIGTIKTIGFLNGKQHTSRMEHDLVKDDDDGRGSAGGEETMLVELVSCLFVEQHTDISSVTDSNTTRNEEILGMVQTIAGAASSSSSSSSSQILQRHVVQEGNNHENHGHSCSPSAASPPPPPPPSWGKENGIYVYGSQNAQIPIGPFQRQQRQSSHMKSPNNNMIGAGTSTTPRLTTNTRYLVTLLQHSSPPNHGLSKDDLALLLGCDCDQEFQALEHGLNILLSNCEIYQCEFGRFLPL
jgi:hypothetical protein